MRLEEFLNEGHVKKFNRPSTDGVRFTYEITPHFSDQEIDWYIRFVWERIYGESFVNLKEDAWQDAFIRVWSAMPKYDPNVGAVTTFLYIVIRRQFISTVNATKNSRISKPIEKFMDAGLLRHMAIKINSRESTKDPDEFHPRNAPPPIVYGVDMQPEQSEKLISDQLFERLKEKFEGVRPGDKKTAVQILQGEVGTDIAAVEGVTKQAVNARYRRALPVVAKTLYEEGYI